MKSISKSSKVENRSLPEFRHAFAGLAAVLSADVISLGFHVYERFPDIDVPMHVAGGFFVGLFAICVRNELLRRRLIARAPWWYDLIFAVGFVAVVAIFWELYEFVLDATYVASHHLMKSQISVADTVDDLMNGIIGAAFAFWVHGSAKK
ncbi:MAG: hypothetical protein WCO25_00280 [Candidatus Uhrbacteria bacterium]